MGTTTRDSASCFPLVSLPPFLPLPCKSRLLFLSVPPPHARFCLAESREVLPNGGLRFTAFEFLVQVWAWTFGQ